MTLINEKKVELGTIDILYVSRFFFFFLSINVEWLSRKIIAAIGKLITYNNLNLEFEYLIFNIQKLMMYAKLYNILFGKLVNYYDE